MINGKPVADVPVEARRILVIDDTESIHVDFRKTLGSSGQRDQLADVEAELFGDAPAAAAQARFELDSAMQGQDGFRKLREAKLANRPYAMAFVDMRMPPGWDGVETIKNLWKEDPNLQVVICTAYSDYSWEQITKELGASDQLLILKKPFDPAEVCQLATALTEKWHLTQQARLQVAQLEEMVEDRTQELRHAALHDRLTGLPNRALLAESLTKSIARAGTGEKKFGLLFLDFDRFKLINDSLGHEVGDMLLVAIAQRLTTALRQHMPSMPVQYLAARLGGDEFVIVLDHLHSAQQAVQFAEILLASLRQPYLLRGHEVCISASIGITTSDLEYVLAEDVIRDADNAMYRAKMLGRDRYVLFDRSMHEQVCARLEIEMDLRKALERGEFFVLYQPIVATESGAIVGFEALVRWRHPTRGVVSPVVFIPIAEETGLICDLGAWVLRTACQQLAQWRQQYGVTDLYMSVNLSKRQLFEPGLVPSVAEVLEKNSLPARVLKLEITESMIMDHPEVIIPLLEQIRAMGVGLSMDDFGTGHSSLTLLKKFPVDVLKIDRGFITDLDGSHQYSAIVHAIVSLAGNMNMHVTAEGIENLAQLAQVQALDCQSAQGFLFSRPISPEACADLLAKGEPLVNTVDVAVS